MKLQKLSMIGLLCLCAGCASYTHTRVASDGTQDKTSVTTFLMSGKAGKLSSYTKDGQYTRRVGVGTIEGGGDAEMFRALYQAGMAAGQAAAVP